MVKEAPLRVTRKGYEDVNVAVAAEVIPQDRTEKTKFHDLPPSAKVSYLFFRDIDIHFHHGFALGVNNQISLDCRGVSHP